MRTFLLVLACGAMASAQSPEFDVASIRVNKSRPIMALGPGLNNGLFRTTSTLRTLLASAYGVDSTRIIGPAWIENDYFEIVAKAPKGVPDSQMKPMLQALLKKRFGLEEHTEQRELPVYDLVVAKGGAKITPYSAEAYSRPGAKRADEIRPAGIDLRSSSQMSMASTTMERFSLTLSRGAGRPVVDKTGLSGKFSLFLYYAPPGGDASGTNNPDLFTAVETELGLKLQAAKEEMPVIVVDHLEKAPTEN